MPNGYITFEQVQPPVGIPIVCLFRMDDMAETKGLAYYANAMSKAIRRDDGEVYYHSDTNPGRGRIRGRLIAWKRCWW